VEIIVSEGKAAHLNYIVECSSMEEHILDTNAGKQLS
jgi:hypothetical protein